MKENRKKYLQGIQDPEDSISQIYDPFSKNVPNKTIQPIKIVNEMKCCVTLFEDQQQTDDNKDLLESRGSAHNQVELNVMKQIFVNGNNQRPGNKQIQYKNNNNSVKSTKGILDKIIANKKKFVQTHQSELKQNYQKYEQYGFNNNFRVAYPQTPGFKNLLSSPFGKFNSLFKDAILTLSKDTDSQQNRAPIQMLQLSANPLVFYNKNKQICESGRYFLGLSLKFKQTNNINECLYFCCLACYADPFSSQTWRKYISALEQCGKLKKATAIAKTGFLFTQNQQLMKSFISSGQKCGIQLKKIQGIMCSVSKPQQFEKTMLPQSAKIQLKYGKMWKGVKVLWQICKNNDYKLSVCIITLMLARFLENMGFLDEAMFLLRKSFSKAMSKLQIYLLYLQISIRKNKCLIEMDLQQVMKYLDCISGQNRYKMWLQIAQILFHNSDQRYYMFISNAFRSAMQFCAIGAGRNKALKQIYYSVSKLFNISPNVKNISSDSTIFQLNRYRFVNGHPLIQYQFQDWKFYLHYGLVKRHDLLASAAKKYPLTGRIIAQWIHCLRLTRKPLEILKVWREKIDQVPKSGQLWCEGGRIYAELGQYSNAQKCFRCAMHFTPQYGDSFIQQLRLLLNDSRFLQIQKLKKLFLVSQPFYGHALSYLKLANWHTRQLTLNQIWSNAYHQISQDLYNRRANTKILTACSSYNYSYAYQSSSEQKARLFMSYQQMQNKN